MLNKAILLLNCFFKKYISKTITEYIYNKKGAILYHQHYVDTDQQQFFSRIEWDLTSFTTPKNQILIELKDLFSSFDATLNLYFSDEPTRTAIFVSNSSDCLFNLIACKYSNELNMEIPIIISNHESLADLAKLFNIPFYYFPINKDNKEEQEEKQLILLKQNKINCIVLARYMQILTPNLILKYSNQIINIHHGFLPSFPGSKPYHQAYEYGVKMIGVTSHYVTKELDQGPIILQDTANVVHSNTPEDLIRIGSHLEKSVLIKAIWNHINHRIIVNGRRTIIFN